LAANAGLVPQNLQSNYQQPTTRAEFAALAVALYETINNREIAGRIAFNDTNDINVQKASYIGVVSGVGEGNFAPDNPLTREQAAVVLSHLTPLVLGWNFSASPPRFSDNGAISPWALEAVGKMQAGNIMGGVGNNMFDPLGIYTREDSIITIWQLYEIAALPLFYAELERNGITLRGIFNSETGSFQEGFAYMPYQWVADGVFCPETGMFLIGARLFNIGRLEIGTFHPVTGHMTEGIQRSADGTVFVGLFDENDGRRTNGTLFRTDGSAVSTFFDGTHTHVTETENAGELFAPFGESIEIMLSIFRNTSLRRD